MNSDEYLDEVYRLLQQNFSADDVSGGMSVATVASLVKRSIGKDQTAFGFEKFKDVLQRLEERTLLKTGPNSKYAFSCWLTTPPEQKMTVVPEPANPARKWFGRLRSQVWHAFIAVAPTGRRFLHCKTGEVRLGLSERPTADDDWIEILTIDPSLEQERALEFLKERSIDAPEIIASVRSPRWYVDFPKLLVLRNPLHATEWKRERTHRAIAFVKDWAQRNNIDERLLFDEFRRKPSAVETGKGISEDKKLKQILRAVVERMSEDELLSLTLPARHLIAVLRPDLLS